MKLKVIIDDFDKGWNEIRDTSKNKNFNEKENTEMKRLNLYESRLFGRICYGFGRDEEGYVFVKEEANVWVFLFSVFQKIFNH